MEQIDSLEETRGRHRRRHALEQTRWHGRVGGDELWRRRVGVDSLVETRWRRRVVAQTRWRRRVEADAWEADVSGFLKNEQSIFPYQISFPDGPQMQFLSCPWGVPLQRPFFESHRYFISFGFIRRGHKSLQKLMF